VKDQPGPHGKVICPTLLNQSCRICKKTGHTSSYSPQYRRREEQPRRDRRREEPRREEPRREERYIEREREPRDYYYHDDRRREEPRREERYIEREQPRDRDCDRRHQKRDVSFNLLDEDTERREREIRDRDNAYYHEQDRLAKPWLQVALKPANGSSSEQSQRRQPYAHPHGPRVRLEIEAPALCASKHAAEEVPVVAPIIDICKVTLNHASKWGDEDNEEPFVYNPEAMSREFFQECVMSGLTTSKEHDFIAECDDQSEMPFFCGQ